MPSGPPSAMRAAALAAESVPMLVPTSHTGTRRDLAHRRDRLLDVRRVLLGRAEVPQAARLIGGRVQNGHQEALAHPAHAGSAPGNCPGAGRGRRRQGQVAVAAREDDHGGDRSAFRAQQQERLRDPRARRHRAHLLVGGARRATGERAAQDDARPRAARRRRRVMARADDRRRAVPLARRRVAVVQSGRVRTRGGRGGGEDGDDLRRGLPARAARPGGILGRGGRGHPLGAAVGPGARRDSRPPFYRWFPGGGSTPATTPSTCTSTAAAASSSR